MENKKKLGNGIPYNVPEDFDPLTVNKNQSQPILQDNVMEDIPFTIKEVEKWIIGVYGYIPESWDYRQVVRSIQQYHNDFIQQLKSRITSLSTANAFHKKAAEEAVLEQHRLIKENTTLLEVIQEQERAKDILINRIEGLRNGIK